MYKILVIEDDPVIREELAALLRADGYQVTEDLPCDLALLDINLPGENGFEICRRLRKHSDVPVIFLTAREAVEDEIVGFGVGADDYIRKPYNSAVLLMRIARLLKRNAEPVRTVRGSAGGLRGTDGGADEERSPDPCLSDEKGSVHQTGDRRRSVEQQLLYRRKYVVCQY